MKISKRRRENNKEEFAVGFFEDIINFDNERSGRLLHEDNSDSLARFFRTAIIEYKKLKENEDS